MTVSRREFLAASQVVVGEEWRQTAATATPYRAEEHTAAMAAAQKRIREIRQRDVEIPLNTPGMRVRIDQTQHEFPFGNQLWTIDADYRNGRWESPEARARREKHAQLYNAATALCYWTERPGTSASKTEERQGEPKVENFAACVAWAES